MNSEYFFPKGTQIFEVPKNLSHTAFQNWYGLPEELANLDIPTKDKMRLQRNPLQVIYYVRFRGDLYFIHYSVNETTKYNATEYSTGSSIIPSQATSPKDCLIKLAGFLSNLAESKQRRVTSEFCQQLEYQNFIHLLS